MQSVTVSHAVLVGIVLLVVLIAGCMSGIVGPQSNTAADSPQPNTATDLPTKSPQPLRVGPETPCAHSLGFYDGFAKGIYHPPNGVSIGFGIGSGVRVVFVAEENGTILGTSFTSADHNSAVDGHDISFDEPLNGTHTVRVTAYEDTNHNQQFDRGIDRPCYIGGERVQTSPKTFNFSSG